MRKTRILIGLAALLAVMSVSAANSRGQTKLEEEGGLSRLIGNWVSTTDDGRISSLTHRWRLSKNAIISRFDVGGRYAGYGLTGYDPVQSKILYVGVDSVGGLGRGHWQFNDDSAVWMMNYVGPDGQERKMGIVHTCDGRKALKTEYYDLDDSGKLAAEPRMTTQYERKPKKPAKRDEAKKNKSSDSSQPAALADLVEMGEFGWIIGNWTGTTDEGQSFTSSYLWSMNKNLINVAFKFGEQEGLGIIFYAPQEGKVMQIGVDSQGSVTNGFWDAAGDSLVATLDYVALDGNKGKIAIVHTKIDGKTIKVAFHGVDDSGERSAEPWAALEYKRQAKKKTQVQPTK